MEDKLEKEKDGMLISKRLQSKTLDPDMDNFFRQDYRGALSAWFQTKPLNRHDQAAGCWEGFLEHSWCHQAHGVHILRRPTFVTLQLSCQDTDERHWLVERQIDGAKVRIHTSASICILNVILPSPAIFSNSFGPSALLFAAPTLTSITTYAEGFAPSGSSNDQFRISLSTIEVPLDEVLFNDNSFSGNAWGPGVNSAGRAIQHSIKKLDGSSSSKDWAVFDIVELRCNGLCDRIGQIRYAVLKL